MEPSLTNAPLRQQGVEALRGGQIDAAIDALSRHLTSAPDDAEALGWLGVACSQKGLHDQAVPYLDRAAHLQPAMPGLHFNRAVALERAGRAADAAAAYQQTLRLNPSHPQARQRLEALGALAA